VSVESEVRSKTWEVDAVLDAASSTRELFEEHCLPLAQALVEGFAGAVLAYGQTGSGKTHSMEGSAADPGVTPRTLRALARLREEKEGSPASVGVAAVEVYCGRVRDLFARVKWSDVRAVADALAVGGAEEGCAEAARRARRHGKEDLAELALARRAPPTRQGNPLALVVALRDAEQRLCVAEAWKETGRVETDMQGGRKLDEEGGGGQGGEERGETAERTVQEWRKGVEAFDAAFDASTMFSCSGLTEFPLTDADTSQALLLLAGAFRATAATDMNQHSSRSHALVTVIARQAAHAHPSPLARRSTLHLVDLGLVSRCVGGGGPAKILFGACPQPGPGPPFVSGAQEALTLRCAAQQTKTLQ
jgi:hypothetical protein